MPPNTNIRGAYRERAESVDTSTFVEIKGAYANDTDAAANGVLIGDVYEMTLQNTYGLPWGTLKVRREP